MPATARAFVKASVVYLCLGALLGALMLLDRWISLDSSIYALRDSHVVMLVVGWLTQLIVGVAWWLFPPLKIGLVPGRPRPVRRGQAQRGSEPLFWATFAFLNAGVLLEAAGEPLVLWTGIQAYRSVAGVSDLLLLAAAVAFVVNVWKRVRALGR
jgi:hypothetical protein